MKSETVKLIPARKNTSALETEELFILAALLALLIISVALFAYSTKKLNRMNYATIDMTTNKSRLTINQDKQ